MPDFRVMNCRMHVYDSNKLVFVGVFRDNNPDNRKIKVFLDNTELQVNYEMKTGIQVRQKYLSHNLNVSEEIIGEVELPFGWEKKRTLVIKSILEESKRNTVKEVGRFSVSTIQKMCQSVQYSIDTVMMEDDTLSVIGWTIGDEDVDIVLYDDTELVPCEVTRTYRRDLIYAFHEISADCHAGFKLEAKLGNKKKYKLVFRTSKHESEYIIRTTVTKTEKLLAKIDVVMRYLKSYGWKMTIKKALEKFSNSKGFEDGTSYENWIEKYDLKKDEIKAQELTYFEYRPKFSIVVPLFDTKPEFLRELIDSIIQQTYKNWELCLTDGTGEDTPLKSIVEKYCNRDNRIKYRVLSENKGISENTNAAFDMATGEFIVLVDHDDVLPANALYECTKAINEDNTIDVIYSDEDKIDMDGKIRFEPHFKPDFNIDLLCSMNYICHLFVVRKDIVEKVGVLRSEFDGAQDHDFILRCCEVAHNIKHVPKILYHWRCHMNSTAANPESKRYAFEAGRRAVEEHYKRVGIPATVEHAEFYGMYRTKYHWDETPLISIIIPNKDHIDDLKKIMNSIDEKSTYRNYEFIVVENNSTDENTFLYYREIEQRDNVQVLYYKGDFNFSRINNFGVEKSEGEYLLLLNNDTEIIAPECLEEMLNICMREEVGIVGAKLCYDDDTIQHAGVVLGFGGIAGHTFIGSSRFDLGYASRIACVQDYTAVTAACMMTKRSVYDAVGGLTEEFKVAFNDIDYCMKVRALNKLVVYTPYAELYHYESKSRGMEDTPEKVERFNSEVDRFINKWNKELLAGDPYYNCNLTLNKADFSLKE